MIDRIGQVWELYSGLVYLVVKSYPYPHRESEWTAHDVLILNVENDVDYTAGDVDPMWVELEVDRVRMWDSQKSGRWRLG